MTRTFYLLLGAGIIALTAIAPEPAAAQSKYTASPKSGSLSGLSAKPPKDHGTSITSMNKKAQGGPATGRRQYQPFVIKPPGLSMDPGHGPMKQRGSRK